MGTMSDLIIEKLNSLLQSADEKYQLLQQELTRCQNHLEKIPLIIHQLETLENKLDYIKELPKTEEEKLTSVSRKINEQQKTLDSMKNILKDKKVPTVKKKTNGFKPLERPDKNPVPNMIFLEPSTSSTSIRYENPKETRDLKMMSIFGKKKGVQLLNAEEFEYNEIEHEVKNASIPKLDFKQIYKRGTFDLMDSHHFKLLEFTTPSTTGETDLLMITPEEVARARTKKYQFMHIGAVQVGIKLLAREGINCSVLCVLQDNRLTDFQASLLGNLEASFCNQVAYFN